MADLRPGDVYAGTGTPPALVGTQPLWSDDSDSSYAEFSPADISQARADFDPFTTTALRFSISVRAEKIAPAGSLSVTLLDRSITELYVNWNGVGVDDPMFPPTWFNTGIYPVSGSLFKTGPTLIINTQSSSTTAIPAIRVYEVILHVYGVVQPPRRLSQRGDGLTGGAPRLIGNRSHQSSNRLNSGFI